jgi:hypothetical protein
MANSPMYLGGDLTKLDNFAKSAFTNDELIAVDQSGLARRAGHWRPAARVEVEASGRQYLCCCLQPERSVQQSDSSLDRSRLPPCLEGVGCVDPYQPWPIIGCIHRDHPWPRLTITASHSPGHGYTARQPGLRSRDRSDRRRLVCFFLLRLFWWRKGDLSRRIDLQQ